METPEQKVQPQVIQTSPQAFECPLNLNKILIVDDLAPNRRLTSLMFRGTEFETSEVDSAKAALEKVREEMPFLVLSDVQMPEVNGYQLCEAIKSDPATAQIAVIFVTAHNRSTEFATHGLDIGADDYIYRPFEREELLARIRAVARLKRAESEVRHQAYVVERRNRELELLNQVGQALTSTLDTQQVLGRTTQLVQEALGAEIGSLWLLDNEQKHLVLIATSGPNAQEVLGYKLPASQGIAGRVVASGESYFSEDVLGDEVHNRELSNTSTYQTRSILCVPLRVAGRVMGAIQALHSQPKKFTQSDLQLFQSVSSSVSIAVDNANLFEEINTFNQQLEAKVAERTRELEQEKDKTWAILANMADALIVTDNEHRILIANAVAEDMLNFRLSEMMGQPIPAELLENALWSAIASIACSDELTTTVTVDQPDPMRPEGVLSVEARASKMWDEDGKIVGTVIVLRDLTALKEVERMKARFMAGVTHELKTPLAVIRTHANNLTTYYKRLPERKRKELVGGIEKQVKLLERLVGEILDIARFDSGVILNRQKENLVPLVDDIVDELRTLAEHKHLDLVWQKPSFPLMVDVDAEQIQRAMRNLVDNAIKYTQSGSVQVEAMEAIVEGRDVVALRVSDTGIGIPPEQLGDGSTSARIFERFYRVDPAHTVPGTGLGLAIVKEIVLAHGGDIHVSSIEGEGSLFLLTLPGAE